MRFPRSSGILLHPTSLPGAYGCGDLGDVSHHFIDWLAVAGQGLWQVLPLEPTGYGNSPYMALSAFAGNPLLIGFDDLLACGLLTREELLPVPSVSPSRVDFTQIVPYRMQWLRVASERFFAREHPVENQEFEAFCAAEKHWLDDFSLFQGLNVRFGGVVWTEWDPDHALRKPKILERARRELSNEIRFWKWTQWEFFRQWGRVKRYANEKGIRIVGDIPIFIAHHSADVWSHPELYFLDDRGNPLVVAGVPPDYFSATGQRWGNPLYRWDVMEQQQYRWWIERFRRTLTLVDITRIDHFRGFVEYWEIPSSEKTAVKGRWVEGPKEKLFQAVQKKLGKLPIIAEDLGIITPEVTKLREKFAFPGMKVLHFAFAEGPENNFLPHHYESNCVVYTGTHDNDTTQGWYDKATEPERDFVRRYCSTDAREIHWDLIGLASGSAADLAIFPFQDILGLGSEGRMNFPGTAMGNWDWRFSWDQVGPEHATRIHELSALFGRVPGR